MGAAVAVTSSHPSGSEALGACDFSLSRSAAFAVTTTGRKALSGIFVASSGFKSARRAAYRFQIKCGNSSDKSAVRHGNEYGLPPCAPQQQVSSDASGSDRSG